MNYRGIIRWSARAILLFLSFIGIASLITNANPLVHLDKQTVQVAWVFAVGAPIAFILSFFKFGKPRV